MRLLKAVIFALCLLGGANPSFAIDKDVERLIRSVNVDDRGALISILENAASHGIDPARYAINDLVQSGNDEAAVFALWRYASDLAGQDLSAENFLKLLQSQNLQADLDALAPQTPLYKALRERLAQLVSMPEATSTPLSFGEKTLHPDESHPDVLSLRIRFGGNTLAAVPEDSTVYDEALVNAVKAYQARHGLKDDGIIGSGTLALLNKTNADRVKQVRVNMDRLRSVEWRNRPPLRMEADVSSYVLTAYEGGEIAFTMPVVVGSDTRKTNIFSTVMRGVRINPGWTVPETVKTEDYIPLLRSNPEKITEKGILIYADWGADSEVVDPTTIDWNALSDNAIKAMRMYKKAGSKNPLGQYRFLMPNEFDIYLHDTDERHMFGQTMRAQSSGCVRLKNPRKVADFLLKDNPEWQGEALDNLLESGKTKDIYADRAIPVYFDYKTAWLDTDGQLVLGTDIYNLDNDSYVAIMEKSQQTANSVKEHGSSVASKSFQQDVSPIRSF